MDYPNELLPSPQYKSIACDLSACKLIRFFYSSEGAQLLDENQEVIVDNFVERSDRLIDISTFLLGVFKPEHVFISLTKEGKAIYDKYCAPDAEVEAPVHPDHCQIDENRKSVFLSVAELHLKDYNYENPQTNANESFVCHVVHTPKLYNFWHFSIRWHNGDGYLVDLINENKIRKKTATKKINHWAKVLLKTSAKLEVGDYNVLSEDEYTNH